MTQPTPGDYFYWKAPNSPEPHYHFILNSPDANGEVLVANMTSQPPVKGVRFDTSCILIPGDEPFVKHPSYVYYNGTQTMPASEAARIAQRLKGKRRGKLKPATLKKVLDGASITIEMDPELQQQHFPSANPRNHATLGNGNPRPHQGKRDKQRKCRSKARRGKHPHS